MFDTLLVANRGEIACRIMRTAHEMGLRCVAVYADPDAGAPHVAAADVAVRLPGSTAAETYLRADALVAAARAAGAQAVHPGYGFLAEDAGFARACVAAGLIFVGPPAEAIEAMASKVAAKRRMQAAGVPVARWAPIAGLSATELVAAGQQVGYPLFVKASFGGGGRGMRLVAAPAQLAEAVAAAAGEARAAFGDGEVFLEACASRARHVEVQVLGDRHGEVIALGERECSVQRRYQKIVEEAPAPGVTPEQRARLQAAAVAAAQAIGYVGAGTVEFLLDAQGDVTFLEVNTRLQVEHPVTEAVTGCDLVRLQLQVAAGEPLPAAAREARVRGHAISARLYAEDPAAGYRPQTGVLACFAIGEGPTGAGSAASPPVRVDAGVAPGSTVSPFFDPLLAKVIAWAPDRAEAARKLARALRGATLHGLQTNRDQLVRVLTDAEFLAAEVDTSWVERNQARLTTPLADPPVLARLALAAALAAAHQAAQPAGPPAAHREAAHPVGWGERAVGPRLAPGWRNNPSQLQRRTLRLGTGQRLVVDYAFDHAGVVRTARVAPGDEAGAPDGVRHEWLLRVPEDARVLASGPLDVVLEDGALTRRYAVCRHGATWAVDGADGAAEWIEEPRLPRPSALAVPGGLVAQMPGSIVEVVRDVGAAVRAGETVVVLEAMKMQHRVTAGVDGVVTEVRVRAGEQVEAGRVLAVVEPRA